MVDKGIRGGICYSICLYRETNKNCIKDYGQNK